MKSGVENARDVEERKFYNEYKRLKGKYITSYEEYIYWYRLLTHLTAARIGGYSPIWSNDGFMHMIEIMDATYHRTIKDNIRKEIKNYDIEKEFDIFF